ncbi:MAG: c-type cytochrome biogenesis protein CcmI, partial [Colwellia sp.]
NPDDAKTWYNLGQTLVSAGGFDLAIDAFEHVIRIEGEHADLLGAIAQASYYRNNQQIDAQVQTLIDRALALDSSDPSTNILLGMHNFMAGQYKAAIHYWQVVISDNRPNINVAALQDAINEANNRLNVPSENEPLNRTEIKEPQLEVHISLSTEITEQLANSEDKVVFVYAIPTNGQRMPLAALKLMASDLPKTVTLNNSNAMSAQNNLSSVTKVHLYAIVSQQGGAGIKPGDFKAEIYNVAVDTKDKVFLVIDSLVTDKVGEK